jgi:hypothetical protein
MARSIEPVAGDPARVLSERVAVRPEISRPLPGSAWPGSARSGRAASLSHGTAVEASILARLLGIPLLRLDAHIDMVPTGSDSIVERYTTAPMIELTTSPVAPDASAASSSMLADAAQLLEHASRTLGDVRRERVAQHR